MVKKHQNSNPVDEAYLQELISGVPSRSAPVVEDTEPTKALPDETPDRENNRACDVGEYARRFLASRPCENRQGVYIDRELHAKISVIIGIVGKRNLTVGNFIDNVLAHHFERYAEDIKHFCSTHYNKIF